MIDRNENVNKVNDVSIRYVANWLTGPFLGAWRQFCKTKNKNATKDSFPFPEMTHIEQSDLLIRIARGSVTERIAKKDILPLLLKNSSSTAINVDTVISNISKRDSISFTSDVDLDSLCLDLLDTYRDEYLQYINNKRERVVMKFFMGKIMEVTKGSIDARKVSQIIKEKIEMRKEKDLNTIDSEDN